MRKHRNETLKTANRKPKTANRLYAVSLGCPKNLVDTEIMLGRLTQAAGKWWRPRRPPQLLLVNTCGFIQPACKEAVDTILELARHKEADPGKRLVVTGCLVQRYGEALAADLPEVDLFVGVNDFPALPDILDRRPGTADGRLFHQAPPYAYGRARSPLPRHAPASGLPEDRRGLQPPLHLLSHPADSRPLAQPAAGHPGGRGGSLAAAGVKELILVAQDTTAYGLDQPGHPGLPELLQALGRH